MIWVCRAGIDSVYMDYIIETHRIYLPWSGFNVNLKEYKDIEEIRNLVRTEKGDVANTSISTWSGQLRIFSQQMSIDDIVLIPRFRSREYCIAKVISDYCFDSNNPRGLCHSRKISIIEDNVNRDEFSQSMQYTLGAYRTVFRIKNEEEIIEIIEKHKGEV
jgi:restriction system protein